MDIKRLVIIGMAVMLLACKAERPVYEGPDYIMFSEQNYTLGILDDEEWFEIPVSATRTSTENRNIGVEVIAAESSAVEDREFILESHTVTIKAGELTTAVRIKGVAEAISPNVPVEIRLNLVIDDDKVWDEYGTETSVTLQRCCPFDINNFTGYAVLTSTWSMQYMNTESRLVHTHLDKEDGVIVIEDMFYDGYDIRALLTSEDRLNPIAMLCGAQVAGATGEAFGTIYGNGKLMMDESMGYVSYYGTCENFLVLYTTMYVEEVGTVGNYVNILEWISDDEAERIMRDGF